MNPALQKIVVVMPSQVTADTLMGSGALEIVQQVFSVDFLCAGEFRGIPTGDRTRILQPAALRSRWRVFLDIHFWYHELFVYLRQAGIGYHQSFKVAYLKRYQRWLHRLLALRPFHSFVNWLDRKVIFRVDSAFVDYLREVRPALVIYPGSAMDSYSHYVVRSAQSLGIPTLMIVSHWDYFSKKGMLRTAPRRIYLWGEDMRELVMRRDSVAADALRVLGAPHFQKYLSSEISRERARHALGLPPAGRILLFAGTSTPYDEVAVLARLSNFLIQSRLNDIRIIYRPHPRAWKRIVREATDPRHLPGVLVDEPDAPRTVSGDHVTALMHAIDAIVSPFSTMILEAALCGRPAFCVGFADGVNSWDFAEALNNEHIAILRGRSWLSICKDSDRLEGQFAEFLASLDRPGVGEAIRDEVQRTVFHDDRTYADRLKDAIIEDFFPKECQAEVTAGD